MGRTHRASAHGFRLPGIHRFTMSNSQRSARPGGRSTMSSCDRFEPGFAFCSPDEIRGGRAIREAFPDFIRATAILFPPRTARERSAARALVRIAAPWCSPASLPTRGEAREHRNTFAKAFHAPVT